MKQEILKQFELKNKVAVVTGALGILGKTFCQALSEAGATVAVLDLSQAECEEFSKSLKAEYGTKSIGIGCDVSDPAQVKKSLGKIVKDLGGVHILLNNAATKSKDVTAFFESYENYSLDEWKEVMATNLDGMFLMSQAVGQQMIQQKSGGSIIQTASIYGVVAPDQRIYDGCSYLGAQMSSPAVYSASKGGVIALTRHLASYWAKYGIRVNTLTPGGIESGQNQKFIDAYTARVPLARMGRPADLVGAVLFLASDASSYMTGQNIIIDGGLTTW